ncbi:FAD-dependent oxidoreductase [Sulfobacillus thermosulfidooxidans]|uniref:FAD-dependent oxidoreductase n=1 Tax=Sulfobacillus thermosulfidooxidans TaxID=28034 RepID=UPI0006B46C53|nr:FAD-dependent oxidoreductase [Sulfobacillus thermosulfidooxidans]
MSTSVAVIGGGPAGLQAAATLSHLGFEVTLVEQQNFLGGAVARHQYQVLMPDFSSGPELLKRLIQTVNEDPHVKVYTDTKVGSVLESDGTFHIQLEGAHQENIKAQAVVLATGFDHFNPARDGKYGYGLFPDVITGAELEEMFAKGPIRRPSNGEVPESVAFIYCVGSRDRQVGNTYCSRVCCAVSAKQAIELRQQLPKARISMFYMDVRTYGLWEDTLYWRSQEEAGVVYVKGRIAEVTQLHGRPVLKGEDTLVRGPFEWPFDLVVLAAGMEPSRGTHDLAQKFQVSLESHGFIQQASPMQNASLTNRPGVFVAGAASGPKAIEDSIAEGDVASLAVYEYLKAKVTL